MFALKKCLTTLILTLVAAGSTSIAAAADSTETIAFRLPDWKTSHFNDAQQAQQHVETLRQLGCEIAVDQHEGHTDVKARTMVWKELSVASHELADQWEQWLKSAGFETLHGHSHAPARGAIAVEFRLDTWQTEHFQNAGQATEFLAVCKALGCEVRR